VLTITQIKQLMREYGVRPNKRLGQDFIIDKNIADKIIKAAGIENNDVVLEIGAGFGNITKELAHIAKKVIAVEVDKGLFNILKKTLEGYENIELVHQDILKFDFGPYAQKEKLRIIGNIPYCITTPILEHIIDNKAYIKDALLMMQKEVAERIVAKSPNKAYSPITCYIQYYTKPEFKTVVKRTSFFPMPDVDSALIYLKVLTKPSVAVNNEGLFFKIIRTAFGQRRKMLLSSLSAKNQLGIEKGRFKEILLRAGVAPERRPESLTLEEFARIANELPG